MTRKPREQKLYLARDKVDCGAFYGLFTERPYRTDDGEWRTTELGNKYTPGDCPFAGNVRLKPGGGPVLVKLVRVRTKQVRRK